MLYGDKAFDGVGFPTPSEVPLDVACRTVQIPANTAWEAVLMGLVTLLLDEGNWQQFEGGITREEAVTAWQEVVDSMYASAEQGVDACAGVNLSPFWDDVNGDDADGSPATNTYEWGDRVADWAIAGFIASSGNIGAAVTYLTNAQRFRLLLQGHDLGGIVRVLLDDVVMAEVDTYSATDVLIPLDIVVPA